MCHFLIVCFYITHLCNDLVSVPPPSIFEGPEAGLNFLLFCPLDTKNRNCFKGTQLLSLPTRLASNYCWAVVPGLAVIVI